MIKTLYDSNTELSIKYLGLKITPQNVNKNNGKCLLCDNSPETLIHLFCLCPQVTILWKDIENWIHFRTNIKVKLSVPEILFGYLKSDYFIPLNTIILETKNYIFSASRKKS